MVRVLAPASCAKFVAEGAQVIVANLNLQAALDVAGVSPRPRLAGYNASKGWVITATRARI